MIERSLRLPRKSQLQQDRREVFSKALWFLSVTTFERNRNNVARPDLFRVRRWWVNEARRSCQKSALNRPRNHELRRMTLIQTRIVAVRCDAETL